MLGLMDRDQLRRWIAEAGLVCVGLSSLCATGCIGSSRGSLTAAADSAQVDEQKAGSDEVPGRASLSDRKPAPQARRAGNQQLAARQARRPASRNGDPFLADAQNRQGPPRNAMQQNAAAEQAAARQVAARRAAAQSAQVAQMQAAQAQQNLPAMDRRTGGPVTQVAAQSTVKQRNQAMANDRATVSQVAGTTRINQRPLAQAAARRPVETRSVETRRAKAPVITPAIPDSDSLGGMTVDNGYERQRADRLMARAHDMLGHNFREEALRLASVAYELEKSKQALYRAGEERPSEFIARLQPNSLIPDTETGTRVEHASETVKRPARKSRPAQPVAINHKRSRAQLTDIRAGWQTAPEGSEASKDDATPSAGLPKGENVSPHFEGDSSSGGVTSAANGGHSEVALLAAPRSADSSVTTADANGPILSPVHDDGSTSGPSLAAVDAPSAPGVLASTHGTTSFSDSGLDVPNDIVEAEPIVEERAASRWSAMSIGGLAAGFIGLVGLVYWRRQEQKHYAAAGR